MPNLACDAVALNSMTDPIWSNQLQDKQLQFIIYYVYTCEWDAQFLHYKFNHWLFVLTI